MSNDEVADHVDLDLPPVEPIRRRPQIKELGLGPIWWHHHGSKLTGEPSEVTDNTLTWKGSAAQFILRWVDCEPRTFVVPESQYNWPGSDGKARIVVFPERTYRSHDCWRISWQVIHGVDRAYVNGVISPRTVDLLVMFNLQPHFTDRYDIQNSNNLIKVYGGRAAQQGCFIAWESDYVNALNIPHPGFGHDGDPNISIEVDDRMRQVVQKFIDSHFHAV